MLVRLVALSIAVALPEGARVPRAARVVAWLAALGFVTFVVCLAAALSEPNQVVFGAPLMLRIGMGFGSAAAILTGGVLVAAIWIWARRRGSVWGRIGYSILALALVSATWQAWHWNLLGVA